ncbi:type II toxin-antitoxin system VapC family toxin [Thermoactinospora rubra]|uniref:type II toxin-antitoxin system VapC family toxin n=1 Tax=Thermoactinospora rubra TaxID=1088767 RepID=UPI000A0FEE50|nr:PIN domain-containing protein [Thermoactinospora rubra]
MKRLLCDTGVLIAVFDRGDVNHERCARLLQEETGQLTIPEPVLVETCGFLRNQVRNGPSLELRFLSAMLQGGDFEIVDPTLEDRRRALHLCEMLVSGPLGYVDGIVLAMAERLKITDIATVDYKFVGLGTPLSRIKPLRWILQES